MKTNKQYELGLINYEGYVLKLYCGDTGDFVIYDQWDSIVAVLDAIGFCKFLDGKKTFVDSHGKSWNWLKEHPDARTPLHKIYEYAHSQHGI